MKALNRLASQNAILLTSVDEESNYLVLYSDNAKLIMKLRVALNFCSLNNDSADSA